jgi:hypothetical protein
MFISLTAILYALMHGGILFIPSAVYWDDWVLVDTTSEQILDIFRQAGSAFNITGYLHNGLMPFGLWIYKYLTFFLMGLAGYFLNSILRRNGAFASPVRWCIVLLFILLPFNMARVAIIDFPYTLSYALFFGAWLAIDRYRAAAAILFFLSFNINSLLVFFALPVLDLLYRNCKQHTPASLVKFCLARWELMILPFVFFSIKLFFYKPTGFYAGYNEGYTIASIPSVLAAQARDLYHLKLDPVLTLLTLPLTYIALTKLFSLCKNEELPTANWKLVLWGGITTFIAVFPYWILGYAPTFAEWSSRHQLLMPLGVGIVISALLFYLPAKARTTSLAIIISACLSYGIKGYYDFYIDWQKQLFIIENFKNDPILKKASFVIVQDRTKDLNAIERSYRFYEWNGMLARAIGNEKRFATEPYEVKRYADGEFDQRFHAQYKASEHQRTATENVALVELDSKTRNEKSQDLTPTSNIEYRSRVLNSEERKRMATESTYEFR